MEVQKAIGLRRSVRYLDPNRPVERAKIQKMLEAARRASHWGNVQSLRAVVVERATASEDVLKNLEASVGAWQTRFAPVIIVWYYEDAAVDQQTDRLRELVDARAMGIDYDETKEYLETRLIPFFQQLLKNRQGPGLSAVDCGQGIAYALLLAFEQGLGSCLVGSAKSNDLKPALGLPESASILLLQTLGYPAEDIEGAGQRPRLPFEEFFKLNHFDSPFPRDPSVVAELEASGLIGRQGPWEGRDKELRELAEKFGYPNH